MTWLKQNWLFLLILLVILFLAFGLPFLRDYPTKEEYENWKRDATDEEIYEHIQQFNEEGEFYAP
ncbi:MAG: hypothetical protein HYT63_03050 [Candidatus Yanofskybacteria bacterium]|nr:hypothetical protein [Candidatus Yanofskybacteria bacterium]